MSIHRARILARDRETLANTLFSGLDFPAGGGLVPPVVPVHYDRLHVLVKPWLPGLLASVIGGNILIDVIIGEH